jgi:hypothetical protein
MHLSCHKWWVPSVRWYVMERLPPFSNEFVSVARKVVCELRRLNLDGGGGGTTLVLEIDGNNLLIEDSFLGHEKECGIRNRHMVSCQ